jgi:pimeloyl-ACP methyl ester carboxylesterase
MQRMNQCMWRMNHPSSGNGLYFPMRCFVARAALLAGSIAAAMPAAASAQEIVSVPTRAGVTVRVLLVAPTGSPSATLVMFPGGSGDNHFGEKDGRVWLGTNFLVRAARPLAARGLLVSIIDTPSDQPRGMNDAFRMGKAHLEDVRKVLDVLAERAPSPIYLAGTSRGTLSAAAVAAALGDPPVAGLLLTSSIVAGGRGRNRSATVFDLPLERITMPVLVVHHRQDACSVTPIGAALRLPAALKGSPRVDFVEVEGGDPPRSDPCAGLAAHGYVGREREVVGLIADWIAGKPLPTRVP